MMLNTNNDISGGSESRGYIEIDEHGRAYSPIRADIIYIKSKGGRLEENAI